MQCLANNSWWQGEPPLLSWKYWLPNSKFHSRNPLGWFWNQTWYCGRLSSPKSQLLYQNHFLAIYPFFSTCRHTCAFVSRSPASTNQGNLQRPPHGVDRPILAFETWQNSSIRDYWGYWPLVSTFQLEIFFRCSSIVHRISAVPPYPGLHRFPDGQDYHQWTSDDSKALMKVMFQFCWAWQELKLIMITRYFSLKLQVIYYQL